MSPVTNLVGMLRTAVLPRRVECDACGQGLQYRSYTWRDGAGSDMCQPNTTHITASPLLSTYPREGDR